MRGHFAGTIAASWIVSPLMSGISCVVILTLIRKLIMDARNPLKAGLIALPIIYGLTIFVNVLTVTLNGSKREGTPPLPITFISAPFPFQFLVWKICCCGRFLPLVSVL